MCGIAGLINPAASAHEIEALAASMASELTHRGPDSSGMWLDRDHRVALAHRRLAIQDLSSAGHQPMSSRSGRYVISYNGEIYNFLSIAAELRRNGYTFEGHSDTEALLALIEHLGVADALSRCEGMFAFALWDRSDKTLVLCRDRLGEKPLYYGWLGSRFVFASELKPIIRSFRPQLNVNRDSLSEYMRHGYISAPHSVFREIHKLPPGCLLTVSSRNGPPEDFSPLADHGGTSPRRYWDVRAHARSAPVGEAGAVALVDELDTLLRTVVREQSIADVPLGTFLSGGIDSTVVTAALQAESDRPVRTFTIGFEEADFDEAPFAKQVAAHLKTQHTELYISGRDCLDLVPALPELYDEPFADSSQIPTYLVSRLAREDVVVCLSGDGGDELFGGYNRYVHAESLFRKSGRIPLAVRKTLAACINVPGPARWDRLYQLIARLAPGLVGKQSNVGLKLGKAAEAAQMSSIHEVYRFLMSYWQRPERLVIGGNENGSIYHDAGFRIGSDFCTQAMLWDQANYLPGDNLLKVDRASMAVSLETRLPLLDRRLVEFSWKVPAKLKVANGQGKWLLRQCLLRYVPRELIERPKMGFTVPIGHWLRGPLRGWAENLLDQRKIDAAGYLRAKAVSDKWNEHISGRRDHTNALWAVLMFQAWLEHYGIR